MQKILALGSNGSGQLGIGHTMDVHEPTESLFCDDDVNSTTNNNINARKPNKLVKRIACGGNHTLVLFDDGTVYAAGLNEDGRCGSTGHVADGDSGTSSGSSSNNMAFTRVVLQCKHGVVDRFSHVSAMWAASVFVAAIDHNNDDDDDIDDKKKDGATRENNEMVIVLGSGDKGELGLGLGRTTTAKTPSSVSTNAQTRYMDADSSILPDFPPPGARIRSIASGTNHTVAILSTGEVYGWGAARKGQLGNDSALLARKIIWEPVRVALQNDWFVPETVACGREFTFVSGFRKDTARYMYTILGADGKWNIISSAPSLQKLQKSPQEDRYTVSASWHGVYLHDTVDKTGLAWGRNDRGQLGPLSTTQHFSDNIHNQPVHSADVAQFVAGSEHAIALGLDNKTVLACGWGEHGNCGSSTDEQGDVKRGRVSHIRLPDEILLDDKAKVVQLAAGCATTWIVTSTFS